MTELPNMPGSSLSELAERPAWPKTIGIISIVIASLFLCCGACGLLQLVRGPQQMPEGVTQPPQPPLASAIVQVVGFFLSFLLLVAGIALVKRSNVGRWLHLVYAVLAIPTGLVGLFVTLGMMGSMHQWINDNPKMQKMSGVIMLFTYAVLGISMLPMIYNVFLVIWFGFVKRNADLGAAIDEPYGQQP